MNISELLKTPTSEEDVKRIAQSPCKVMNYSELANYSNVDDLLNPEGAVIILYLSQPNYGHWCCLLKDPKGRIEFFDPYGYCIDDELEFGEREFRKTEKGQWYPHLSKLLLDCPEEIEYNNYEFQKREKGIATCGRHCGYRIRNRDKCLECYKKKLEKLMNLSNLNPDEIVSLLSL